MDGMCNFLKRFFEIFYFSLEVHRNLGDSGCSDVWELMSLLLCSAEGHFSGGLVEGLALELLLGRAQTFLDPRAAVTPSGG